ncbi:MAG TPA: hypothetical protein VD867_05785 [Burkholderiales bacterium]|nr:hypothetical protein [Burkholderiales bacterium]
MNRLAIAIVVGIVLTGMGIFAWNHYDNLVTEREQFRQERDAAAAVAKGNAKLIGELEQDKKRLDALLTQREQARNERARLQETDRAATNQLKESPDQATQRWARDRLPDATVELLCRRTRCAGDAQEPARPDPERPDRADAGPGTGAVPNKLGLTPIRAGRDLIAPGLQR